MEMKSWIFFIVLGAIWGIAGVGYPGSFLFLATRISEVAFSGALLYIFSVIIGAAIVLLIGFVQDELKRKKK